MKHTLHLALVAGLLLASGTCRAATSATPPSAERYPYGSPAFTRFLADSCRRTGQGTPAQFYHWLDKAYRTQNAGKSGSPVTLAALIVSEKQKIVRLPDPTQKTQRELAVATQLHHLVKKAMPNFSLQEGFEFTNSVSKGERQCLLQSVLLAGLLQAMKVDAGVVMINRSLTGTVSNNGHCSALIHLPNGQDVFLDASDPKPFVRHLGLFGVEGGYRFLTPLFQGATPRIVGYTIVGTGGKIAPRHLRFLDAAFLRSQFDYYRGERTIGGLLSPPANWTGLEKEAALLRSSIKLCPQNPLPVYMLGRVYLREARPVPAKRWISQSLSLYNRQGWTPSGALEAAAKLQIGPRSASMPARAARRL
ncbi:MAG: hypothetical protein M3Y13_15970 [Armatimonadota bacterium]|nr:hypothetical protein [Armatimonadota bacterium]